MKNFVLIITLLAFIASCRKEIKLPADKVYIVAYMLRLQQTDLGNDSILVELTPNIENYIEIDKDFNITNILQSECSGEYYSFQKLFSDSLKYKIIDMVEKYDTDTIFPEYAGVCNRRSNYALLVERQGRVIKIGGVSPNFPADINILIDSCMSNTHSIREDITENDWEFVKQRLVFLKESIKKGECESYIASRIVKFVPPIITE